MDFVAIYFMDDAFYKAFGLYLGMFSVHIVEVVRGTFPAGTMRISKRISSRVKRR